MKLNFEEPQRKKVLWKSTYHKSLTPRYFLINNFKCYPKDFQASPLTEQILTFDFNENTPKYILFKIHL